MAAAEPDVADAINIKVAMVGDAGVGKTSLMLRYVSGTFEESYVESLGVSFLEKRIRLPAAEVCMACWDLAGGREHRAMLPTACAEAVAVIFLFDLNDIKTLRSIRTWFAEVRMSNQSARAILVGTKFDVFFGQSTTYKQDIIRRARKYAGIMCAPLVFSSALHSIHVKKVFRLVLSMAFDLPPSMKQIKDPAKPLLEFDHVIAPKARIVAEDAKARPADEPPSRQEVAAASSIETSETETPGGAAVTSASSARPATHAPAVAGTEWRTGREADEEGGTGREAETERHTGREADEEGGTGREAETERHTGRGAEEIRRADTVDAGKR